MFCFEKYLTKNFLSHKNDVSLAKKTQLHSVISLEYGSLNLRKVFKMEYKASVAKLYSSKTGHQSRKNIVHMLVHI